MKFQTANFKFHARPQTAEAASVLEIGNQKSEIGNHRAFSLIEVLVVVSLLSLIVLALMAVFSSTQRAFRSAVTQTEVMEGIRATMDLMVTDLRGLTPAYSAYTSGAVNFFVTNNASYSLPLVANLVSEAAAGSDLSLYFYAADNQVSYLFNSKEFTTNHPELTITAAAVPEPAGFALLSSILAGWLALRRRPGK